MPFFSLVFFAFLFGFPIRNFPGPSLVFFRTLDFSFFLYCSHAYLLDGELVILFPSLLSLQEKRPLAHTHTMPHGHASIT
jgi:hypothetical protein